MRAGLQSKARAKEGSVVVIKNRVAVARIQKDWSMRDLARESGVAPATICRAEMGKEPSLTNAICIARALGYIVEDLWEV